MHQIGLLYVSSEAFTRFARFAGITIVFQSLLFSPAVYSEQRVDAYMKPWIALIGELGFDELLAAVLKFSGPVVADR